MSSGEFSFQLSLSASVTIGGNVGGFGRAREIRLLTECGRLASSPTSSRPGTSGEGDRRWSNAEFKCSRKCVGFDVESSRLLGGTARRSTRELLGIFDRDCRRLLGIENAIGSPVAWNSANNEFKDI